MQNIMVINVILRCFELSSGPRVNVVNMYYEILHCSLMELPFTYLGLLVGGNPSRCSFWEPVLSKIRKKLSV